MKDGLVGRTTLTEEECAKKFDRCACQFGLWKDGRLIAACGTLEAHDAARRLLGEKP